MRPVHFVLLLAATPALAQDPIALTPGLVITESVRIEPGTYHLPGDSLGAVRVQGSGITVDFTGAVLVGSTDVENPDRFEGTGIFVLPGSNDVTVIGATARGYKVALRALDTPGLTITDSDFSYNWRQRLKSTIEREHIDDWMSYHHNEEDEWLRYGAAVYLRGCDGCRVERVTVTGGQNGLMLTEVNDGIFRDNTITFNSSLGIGMYRSSRNRVVHNTLDFNVRGYSHGVYNRGQDSAAILVYEQCNDNEFSYNSATHSGDGFFLWAGQTTMDTGQGGANGNLIWRNDFSFAPTNGIEITFSSNRVEENYIEGCWHGIWGGYSWDTVISGNTFVDNDEHIAIEHGQDVRIERNAFLGGDMGVRLWERDSQPADWGYSRERDVRSRDFDVERNEFRGVDRPIVINGATGLRVQRNAFEATGDWVLEGVTGALTHGNEFSGDAVMPISTGERLGEALRFGAGVDRSHPRGREYILVDEWGPHDFRSPALWPRSARRSSKQWFEVVGPPGSWEFTSLTGVDSVSAMSGAVGDSVRVWRSQAPTVDMRIVAAFSGGEVVDRFGRRFEAGKPVAFEYRYWFAPIAWTVDFWQWEAGVSDPREQPEAFAAVLEGPPLHSLETEDLGFGWYRSPARGVSDNYFATRSVGTVEVPPGRYILDLTSDDGVRVWVDDELVHEDWTWHPPKQELIELELGGRHTIRIDHFEIDGFATVVAGLRRR
ncbi:MAG: right-handed parallel beta-helix repeat-containing protein [Rhodothermales bacterium]|nr:right-handed parallel beta-helix repeat-containing protein [Rhodothermales bacterium]